MSLPVRSKLSTPSLALATAVLAAGLGMAGTNPARAGEGTVRVSLAPDGSQGNSHSLQTSLSADGRFLAYASIATNIVAGDANGSSDVFVLDRQSGTTTRASLGSGGVEAERGGSSLDPSISADGRFVAFESAARNLSSGDTNGVQDVFVHDRQNGTTTRVSVSSSGVQADKDSRAAVISGDGRFVAFQSNATNLVSGDKNSTEDVFVHDLQTKTTTRVSVASGGAESESAGTSTSPAISGDGRFVAFVSAARNLVSSDTNGASDVFVHDRQANQTTRVSVASDGTAANFPSEHPVISSDGRFVAFDSIASNLVAGDTGSSDVFVHDRRTSTTTRVSVAPDGAQADGSSMKPALSADGSFVVFESDARNLVAGDTNSATDVFIHDRQKGLTAPVSVASDGTQSDGRSAEPSVTATGDLVAFHSYGSKLVAGDTNEKVDVFVNAPDFSVTLAPTDPGPGPNDPNNPNNPNPPGGTNPGYWLVASDGGIFAFGDARFFGSTGAIKLNKPIVGMAATRSDAGYWLVASDGGIFAFGDARFFGSTGDIKLNKPVVGMAATPTGAGYWLVASDGGIFSFGDAGFFGSTGAIKLNRPIVGMARTPTGKGYWMVASDGGIFAFGDARFFGSTGAIGLNKPIVAMAPTPTGAGYWLVASDGGIFSFGDARFFGSTASQRPAPAIAAMATTSSGAGYWLVAADGMVSPFGDAASLGSVPRPNQPIVGAAG